MNPTLIFLHGLLGTKADWKFFKTTPRFSAVALDLPFHGENKHIAINDFADANRFLSEQIRAVALNKPYILMGYSLGGRLALSFALDETLPKGDLRGVILEGANFGLNDDAEKAARWQNDCAWASRFENEPPEIVLNDWYQQAVFAHLSEAQRATLIQTRREHCGANIGAMLRATSLAKQPNFLPRLIAQQAQGNFPEIYYLVGERDSKFRALAQTLDLPVTIIPNAGHNAHLENPEFFAKNLKNLVFKIAQGQ